MQVEQLAEKMKDIDEKEIEKILWIIKGMELASVGNEWGRGNMEEVLLQQITLKISVKN